MIILIEIKQLKCHFLGARLASFSRLGHISDIHMFFLKILKWPHKGSNNIKYIIMKYGEKFFGRHTALTTAVLKIKMTIESTENTHKTEISCSVKFSELK